ncbi:PadR family transcriptional regulator [Agromyces sp. SYSU T00194]|uniref:PadR family transcriptional regulator n=1 Tax=Agromyces chitinivorans TaxID=3158560 RepID=UPI00339A09CA
MTPPVFSHGSLRLYLLSLLAEQPRHGYELIQALSDRFGGTYSPSAGTIYPRLAKLEAEGLVVKSADGRKTVYEITDAGRAELAEREHELESIEAEVTDSVRRLADEVRVNVNEALRSMRADLASAAREARRAATEATSVPPEPAPEPRADADGRAVHEADLVINAFRQRVRTDLRTHARRGQVAPEAVDLLRSRLDAVRADLLDELRGR